MARDAKRSSLLGLTAWERHCKLIKDYQEFYGGKLPEQPRTLKTDYDSLVEKHRFIRQPEDDQGNSWEVRLARKYYSKLFKEYAIVDLSRYKLGQLGLRWRTEAEVREGKGQFKCGAKGCSEQRNLASFEVPFAYAEAGQRKQALVKVRLCPKHAVQLNYRKTQEKLKEQQKKRKREQKQADKQAAKAQRRCAEQAAAHKADELHAHQDDPDSEGEQGVSQVNVDDRWDMAGQDGSFGDAFVPLPAESHPEPDGTSAEHGTARHDASEVSRMRSVDPGFRDIDEDAILTSLLM